MTTEMEMEQVHSLFIIIIIDAVFFIHVKHQFYTFDSIQFSIINNGQIHARVAGHYQHFRLIYYVKIFVENEMK